MDYHYGAMLKVGYPASIDPALLSLFPEGIELIALPDKAPETLAHPVELDVWIAPFIGFRVRSLWEKLHGVKVVLSLMAGTDWLIDIVGPGVTVCGAQGAPTIATAEWAVTVTLAMLKFLPHYVDIQNTGNWHRRREVDHAYAAIHGLAPTIGATIQLEELYGKHVLIVGHGSIGQRIETLLAPFGVKITRVARTPRGGTAGQGPLVHSVSELDALLPAADVVILILPLTDETRGLIDARRLGLMKRGALLVNSARGGIVVTDALVDALHAGHIRAAIDVTDPEPLPVGHPLWSCPNLLITPHVAGASPAMTERAMEIAAQQVSCLLEKKPLRNVAQSA